ncbi:DUF4185 domain-containing protein [Dermacoccus sp. Tok2021]|uniref:DUF4185 domain-containing protein n=1 Tax=Dermacoccus sp. Tok2021 TaxID=2826873 RepID=UPI001CA77520|nr:DUF4185 domain-containing protein [Dermacoccus sp. Tok2021]
MRRRRVALVGATGLTLAFGGCTLSVPDSTDRIGSRPFLDRADKALAAAPNALVRSECSAEKRAVTRASAAERGSDMASLSLATWRSGDVGVTTPLSDGRVLWIFGDTTRAKGTNPRVVANSMLVGTGRCFDEVRAPGNGPVIGGFEGRRVCWPNSAMTVPMRGADIVLVGCSRIEPGKEGLFDFSYRGMTMAAYAVERGGAPQPVTRFDVTPDNADAEQINWGSALVGDEGWVYVYGSQQPKGSTGKGAYVARTRLAQLSDGPEWQFWNGRTFVTDAGAARPFLLAHEGVSQTFSVVRRGERFVLVSKQGGEFGQNIGVWSAPIPSGPWRGERAVAEPYSQGDGVVAYQPLAHPELATPSGDLLVTLSRNTESFADLLADPRKGRPKFLEVPAH